MKRRIKTLIRVILGTFGYEITRVRRKGFTISGIRYEVDPCSVGKTPEGEITAEGAIRMIKERQLHDLKILDLCCGVGVVGLTIFSKLSNEGIVKKVTFADINIFSLNSLQRTLRINHLDHLLDNRIHFFLSNGLNNIPSGETFDIIISNPPHYFEQCRIKGKNCLSPNRLGTYDANWDFHKCFYSQCHDSLTKNGEVWFLENGAAAKEGDFLPFIKANHKLNYTTKVREPLDTNFFWMITSKA